VKRLARGRIFVDHILDPLPHFLTTSSKEKKNPPEGTPPSVFKGKSIFQEGRYIFIMSRTSLIILATFLLILSVVCFMAGFLISKSLHERENEKHSSTPSPSVITAHPTAASVPPAPPTINTSPGSKLHVQEEIMGFDALHKGTPTSPRGAVHLPHPMSQRPTLPIPQNISSAQQKYHQLVGLNKETHSPSLPDSHVQKLHPALHTPSHSITTHPARGNLQQRAASRMSPTYPAQEMPRAIPHAAPTYHYDTSGYGPSSIPNAPNASTPMFLNPEGYASHPHAATTAPNNFQQFESATHNPFNPLPSFSPQEYGVQIGSFQDQESAQQLHQELKNRGYDAKVYQGLDNRNHTWYHVRIGQFTSQDQANAVAYHFLNKERTQASVTSVSPQETRIL
jgi:cell division protein FtsN